MLFFTTNQRLILHTRWPKRSRHKPSSNYNCITYNGYVALKELWKNFCPLLAGAELWGESFLGPR